MNSMMAASWWWSGVVGPQALAAGGNDVVGDLVDQHHVRGQARPDQGIDGGHVGLGERLDAGQGEGGAEGFDDGHGATGRKVTQL